MREVLISGGLPETVVQALRRTWQVVEQPSHLDLIEQLRQASSLPQAVVIGYATQPDPHAPGRQVQDNGQLPAQLPAYWVLEQVLQVDADLPVLISTRLREPSAIVALVQQGAFDYLVEPGLGGSAQAWESYQAQLVAALARAVTWREAALRKRRPPAPVAADLPSATCQSTRMQRVMQMVRKVAPTPATVLITGESGTGKEYIARQVHQLSRGSDRLFLPVNCGALGDTLLHSELFGHEKGAFTGADARRPGLVREAGRGTLFLDEVATISPAFQVSLLRTLDARSARPVGGGEHYPVQCRFIAAANRDLAELVQRRQFREDLYYRLNVFHIHLPPLRERVEDIPALAEHFLSRICLSYGVPTRKLRPAAMRALEQYAWPGNIRQLRNVIERAVILAQDTSISHADIASSLSHVDVPDLMAAEAELCNHASLKRKLQQYETRLIRQAMDRSGQNLAEAARLLGVSRTTLQYRAKKLGVSASPSA